MDQTVKTKRLKKYEADATVCARDGNDPPMEFYSPFGPMIAKATLPAAVIDRINRYADGVTSPERGMEFTLPESVVLQGGADSLAQHTANLIKRYLVGVENTEVEAVDFEVFWIVSQYASTPSPVHFHSGELSGVLYLKIPELEEGLTTRTYISGRQAGYINFLIGGRQRLSKSLISFEPRVGDFYIFPGWLLHGAEPFRGKGERRSMAFNAFIKGGSS